MQRLGSTDNHYRLAIKEIKSLPKERQFLLLEIGAGTQILRGFLPKNIAYHTLDKLYF